jgi:hypothetical protein
MSKVVYCKEPLLTDIKVKPFVVKAVLKEQYIFWSDVPV